jgi:hypothetical protein
MRQRGNGRSQLENVPFKSTPIPSLAHRVSKNIGSVRINETAVPLPRACRWASKYAFSPGTTVRRDRAYWGRTTRSADAMEIGRRPAQGKRHAGDRLRDAGSLDRRKRRMHARASPSGERPDRIANPGSSTLGVARQVEQAREETAAMSRRETPQASLRRERDPRARALATTRGDPSPTAAGKYPTRWRDGRQNRLLKSPVVASTGIKNLRRK